MSNLTVSLMALACTFISILIMHPTDTFSPLPPAASAPVRSEAAPYNTYLVDKEWACDARGAEVI